MTLRAPDPRPVSDCVPLALLLLTLMCVAGCDDTYIDIDQGILLFDDFSTEPLPSNDAEAAALPWPIRDLGGFIRPQEGDRVRITAYLRFFNSRFEETTLQRCHIEENAGGWRVRTVHHWQEPGIFLGGARSLASVLVKEPCGIIELPRGPVTILHGSERYEFHVPERVEDERFYCGADRHLECSPFR